MARLSRRLDFPQSHWNQNMRPYSQLLAFCFLLSLGACLPAVASTEIIHSDTPAEPGPCEWESIEGFVDQVLSENLNITDVVLQCPDICSLVYGTGNPDISGPGVMISYYSQVGFTIVYCLFLPAFAYIVANTGLKEGKAPGVVYFLRACQGAVNEINVFYGLTILISAGVRNYTQTPPIVEVIFMSDLFRMQLMILGIFIFSSSYDVFLNSLPPLENEFLYHLGRISLAVLSSMDGGVKVRENALPVFSEVCKLCHSRYGYYDTSAFIKSQRSLGEIAKVTGFSFLLGIGVPGLIVYYLFSDLFKRPRATWSSWWSQYAARFVPTSLQAVKKKFLNHIHILSAIFAAIMCLCTLIFQLVTLEASKKATRNPGEADDNEWGYGQTMAALLWLPILKVALRTLYDMARGDQDLRSSVDQGKDATVPLLDKAAQPPPPTQMLISNYMDLAPSKAGTSTDTSTAQAARPPTSI